MPSLTFVLPHWLYWSGLVLFPLIAGYFAHREHQSGKVVGTSLPIAYLLWLTGGFVGLHRFYTRAAKWTIIYIIFFLLVLYGNKQGKVARIDVSNAQNFVFNAKYDLKRAQKNVALEYPGAVEKRDAAKLDLDKSKTGLDETTAIWKFWQNFSGAFGLAIIVFLLIDALLLPRLYRQCIDREKKEGGRDVSESSNIRGDIELQSTLAVTKVIDKISGMSGHFVCYWSILAVFIYYYEVLARYVFNSPTNWAHEGMFLLFGAQYLLSGAYAFREGAHVRVDVLHAILPERVKLITNIVSSLFFFIFTIALVWTGWIFASDSIEVWEVSFTEWGIQYWPIKLAIPLGAFLILLQGFTKLLEDVQQLIRKGA